MRSDHVKYMERCLQLAQNGLGTTSPNPMVGCVIVHNGKIIGEGWHRKSGSAHAEVNAIRSVADESLLKESTLYVSLEPCSHHGKTPPCTNLIIEKKIPRVVVGCRDRNSAVKGKGVQALQKNGIDVTEDVLEEDSTYVNRRFFSFHGKKKPYILLKWAQSLDGYLDRSRERGEKGVRWISEPHTRTFVHRQRSLNDAILVGSNTVVNDDPALTVREIEAQSPTRLIIDPQLQTRQNARVYDDSNYRLFTLQKTDRKNTTQLKRNEPVLQQVLTFCYLNGIQSVLVEGGAETLQSFIDQNLWDEAMVIVGEVTFGEGLAAPALPTTHHSITEFSSDKILSYFNS